MIKSISAFAGNAQPCGIPTGIDWSRADFSSSEGRAKLLKAIDSYFEDVREGMKTTRPGHLPGSLPERPDIDVRFYGPRFADLGLYDVFRSVDKTASKNPVYKFANVSANAIVFEQKKPGQAVKILNVSGGAPVAVSSVTWHGALGIDDDERRFDDYGIFEENVQRVPAAWENKKLNNLALLLTSLSSGIDEPWDTNLVRTINAACNQIIEDCGEVYQLDDNPAFALVFNPAQWDLVSQALAAKYVLPNDNNSKNQLHWNVNPVPTRRIASGSMYLCLPGYDLVRVTWDDLYSEQGRDFERGVDALVWRARWNAAVGNSSQVRRITPEADQEGG